MLEETRTVLLRVPKLESEFELPVSNLHGFFIDLKSEKTRRGFAPLNLPPRVFRNGLTVCVPDRLSDASMCAPALVLLKQCLPKYCGLFVVTSRRLLPLFGSFSCVDAVVPVENIKKDWFDDEIEKIRSLRSGVGLVLSSSLRCAMQMRQCRFRRLYGMPFAGSRMLLDRTFAPGKPQRGCLVNRHMANFYLDVARAFGATADTPPEVDIPETVWFERSVSELSAIITHPKILLMASGTSNFPSKSWDSAKFRDVAGFWIRHGGIAVLLNPDSKEDAGILTETLPPRRFFLLSDEIDLMKLMHMVRAARCIVSCDNGLAHLGALLGTPGVALFGPTDPTMHAPARPNWRILRAERDCEPCLRRRPKCGNWCMQEIEASDVMHELERFL